MRHGISKGLAALGLAGCVVGIGPALAQTTVITREPVQTQTIVREGPVVLTPTQRTTIYHTIVREQVAPAEGIEIDEVRIGAPAPRGARLHDVPARLATEVPAVSSYRYMVVNNRVVLVDPATSTVVAELDE